MRIKAFIVAALAACAFVSLGAQRPSIGNDILCNIIDCLAAQESPDDPQHWAPVSEPRYAGIIGRLRAQPSRAYWTADERTRMADDIDGLALSADDPGPQSIVMAVDQLRRIANGLRARESFSPPQLAAALAGYVRLPAGAVGDEVAVTAPYAITNADPLVIEKATGAPAGIVAFLENRDAHSYGRTNGTRSGFDFNCTSDGGQGYTGLVWWNGLPGGRTYRAAIELPGGHLSAPEVYEGNPWAWGDVAVFDGPIEPGAGHHRLRPGVSAVGGRIEASRGPTSPARF